MVGIKLTAEEMRYITFFEKLTDARLHDCVISDDGRSIIFVVKKGDMGIAIGKNGSKIKKVQRAIGKSVQVIEHTDDLNEFLNNFLSPARYVVATTDRMGTPTGVGPAGSRRAVTWWRAGT
jgi:N utilization substance protein A